MLTRKLTVTSYIKLCPSMSIHRSETKTKDGVTSGWDMVLRTGSSWQPAFQAHLGSLHRQHLMMRQYATLPLALAQAGLISLSVNIFWKLSVCQASNQCQDGSISKWISNMMLVKFRDSYKILHMNPDRSNIFYMDRKIKSSLKIGQVFYHRMSCNSIAQRCDISLTMKYHDISTLNSQR